MLITHERDIAARAPAHDPDPRRRIWRPTRTAGRHRRGGAPMSWRDTFRTATEAVRTHRLRSALTMLGILIGITAVVLTVGLGQGAKAQVRDQINELGTNLLVVSPGQHDRARTGIRGGFGSASTLTMQDADALASQRRAPDIQAVAPPPRPRRCRSSTASTNWTTTLTGTTPSWQAVRSRRHVRPVHRRGRRAQAAPVVVLGPDTGRELFATRTPSARRSATTA